jgi:hypothetical protein
MAVAVHPRLLEAALPGTSTHHMSHVTVGTTMIDDDAMVMMTHGHIQMDMSTKNTVFVGCVHCSMFPDFGSNIFALHASLEPTAAWSKYSLVAARRSGIRVCLDLPRAENQRFSFGLIASKRTRASATSLCRDFDLSVPASKVQHGRQQGGASRRRGPTDRGRKGGTERRTERFSQRTDKVHIVGSGADFCCTQLSQQCSDAQCGSVPSRNIQFGRQCRGRPFVHW